MECFTARLDGLEFCAPAVLVGSVLGRKAVEGDKEP
jgi:hypothetical protein